MGNYKNNNPYISLVSQLKVLKISSNTTNKILWNIWQKTNIHKLLKKEEAKVYSDLASIGMQYDKNMKKELMDKQQCAFNLFVENIKIMVDDNKTINNEELEKNINKQLNEMGYPSISETYNWNNLDNNINDSQKNKNEIEKINKEEIESSFDNVREIKKNKVKHNNKDWNEIKFNKNFYLHNEEYKKRLHALIHQIRGRPSIIKDKRPKFIKQILNFKKENISALNVIIDPKEEIIVHKNPNKITVELYKSNLMPDITNIKYSTDNNDIKDKTAIKIIKTQNIDTTKSNHKNNEENNNYKSKTSLINKNENNDNF